VVPRVASADETRGIVARSCGATLPFLGVTGDAIGELNRLLEERSGEGQDN
jgi:hypothetical protein